MKVQEKYCIKDLEPIFTQKYLTPGSEYSDVPGELRLMEMITERISKVIELAVVRGVAGGASQVASFNIFVNFLNIRDQHGITVHPGILIIHTVSIR